MTLNTDALDNAWRFAAAAHAGQTIPGSTHPYLLHIALVVTELAAASAAVADFDLPFALCVAVLHDTLEDTAATYETLADTFGVDVADGVQALSKNPALPKEQRMPDSLLRIQQQPRREVAAVKLADRLVNMSRPPESWPQDKRQRYWEEAQLIWRELHTAHEPLAARLHDRIGAYRQYL
ncbi:guanosine polyphosphate pyrophosphohydrolase/synthetase [Caldimonas brevitalea]|uniref:Guanosine polyphosphate pyrophosphohydrolase/synthetase n=2 Tax=Caldimonas brevitalea TaxID=413882 RepID=A0A0G3BFG0_9BURK|nr:guanosine polyphosphate pyrophosphohydrolase/synthetase [Caldimonas brevitalea]